MENENNINYEKSNLNKPKNSLNEKILVLLELGKIRISTAVSFTALLGYVLAKGSLDLTSINIFIGTFLLSLGSSAFNQIQEEKYDKIMQRTKLRPLPLKKIEKFSAISFAIIFCCLGMFVLVEFVGLLPFFFGFITLIFYNVIYTPMKRISSFAVIPGSIVGALPPLIGWTAFNSNYLDPLIISFCFFIFVWQIPHFWILLLIYKDDYKLANYPMITDTIEVKRLRNIIFIWIISLCFTSLFFPYFIENNFYYNKIIILVTNLALSVNLLNQTKNLLSDQEVVPKYLFKSINIYVLWILIIVVLEKIISNLIR